MRTLRKYAMVFASFALCCACSVENPPGGRGGSSSDQEAGLAAPTGAAAGLTDVDSLSHHYVEVQFDGIAAAAAQQPDAYRITVPNGAELAVRAVSMTADPTMLILTTDPQTPVRYTLQAEEALGLGADGAAGLARPSTMEFTGSQKEESFLASAISLSNTELLATFSEEMDAESAEIAAYYVITAVDADNASVLTITEAALADDGRSVVLTTSQQDNIDYQVKVTNVWSIGAADDQAEAMPALIDPTRNTADFRGIPTIDGTAPRLLSAASSGESTVLLSFSEPLADTAADATHFAINPPLLITGALFNLYQTQVLLTTLPQTAGITYTVSAFNAPDKSGNPIDPMASSAAFEYAGAGLTAGQSIIAVVTGAISASNTSVIVNFSKAMGDSAVDPGNYFIVAGNVNKEAGALIIPTARFATDYNGVIDRSKVILTTLSQSTIEYFLAAVGVVDLAGRPLGTAEVAEGGIVVNANTATFWGSGPSGQTIDSDGDGLPDNEEMFGWAVLITLVDGTVTSRDVTCEPFIADTDIDGLTDSVEKLWRTDPRDADSDDDGIRDYDEIHIYFSNPIMQDTDGDTLDDSRELNLFHTSPVLADTDGDGFDDNREILEMSRNPRIADLPASRIDIDGLALRLETLFAFTDTQGVARTSEETVETTFAENESKSFSTSDTISSQLAIGNATELGATQNQGVEGTQGLAFKRTFSLKNTTTAGVTTASSHTANEESTAELQRAYQESLTTSETVDETKEVTREIVGASMEVLLSIANLGDTSFSLKNLEITAMQQDPLDRTQFVPVATLVPAVDLDVPDAFAAPDSPTYNVGPLTPVRGPFIFKSRDIFPTLVEDLLKNPRGLMFTVANFDVEDEFGRNFAFASQDVNERTAGITIDYGNSRVDRFHVATAGTFDAEGRPSGITMRQALQDIIGMAKNAPANAIVVGTNGCGETFASGDDVQVFSPICHDVLRADDVIVTGGPNGTIESIPSGDDYFDVLGSCDDGDPAFEDHYCSDETECGTGLCGGISHEVIRDGGDGCAHTRPFRDDAPAAIYDAQGFVSQTQQTGCEPGGVDGEIILAGPDGVFQTIASGDDEMETIVGYGTKITGVCEGAAVNAGASCVGNNDCDGGACRMREVLSRLNGVAEKTVFRCGPDSPPGRIAFACDPDLPDDCGGGNCLEIPDRFWAVFASGSIDDGADFDDIVLYAGDSFSLAYVQDKDADGLLAREEFFYGSSDVPPRGTNTDGCAFGQGNCDSCAGFDSLGDYDEAKRGWEISVEGRPSYLGYSSPAAPDTDLDGLFDDEEWLYGTDAGKRDTDDDGISDYDELKGFGIYTPDEDHVLLGVVSAYEFGVAIVDGGAAAAIIEPSENGNGTADTEARLDDEQVVEVGEAVGPGVVIVGAGPNGILDSKRCGDDRERMGIAETTASGDDEQIVAVGEAVSGGGVIILPGDNGVLETTPAGDDRRRPQEAGELLAYHGSMFATDPLNRDTDGDTLFDGVERVLGHLGADANNPADAEQFRDDDLDGLVNKEERDGWLAMGVPVTSDPFEVDTDFDGLPDLLERTLRSDPRKRDTDGDGLLDFDEFDPLSRFSINIVDYRDFEDDCFDADRCVYNAAGSLLYGTSPVSIDTDSDGRTDYQELFTSWVIRPCSIDEDGNVSQLPFEVTSSPLFADRDLDLLLDGEEQLALTDPNDPDTDDDGVTDNIDDGPTGCQKIISFEFVSHTVGMDDCDGGTTGPGDFSYYFQIWINDFPVQTFGYGEIELDAFEVATFPDFVYTRDDLVDDDTIHFTGFIVDDDDNGDEAWIFNQAGDVGRTRWAVGDLPSGERDVRPGTGDAWSDCFQDHFLKIRITIGQL